MHFTPWLLFSNVRIPNFEETKANSNTLSIHVYAFNWLSSNETYLYSSKTAVFNLDSGTVDASKRNTTKAGFNFVEVEPDQIRLVTSSRNITPVYLWQNKANLRFVFGTDLPTVMAAVASIRSAPPVLLELDSITLSSSSSARGIERIKHCTEVLFRQETTGWNLMRTYFTDPIDRYRTEVFDPLEAGTAQIETLQTVINEYITCEESISVLVSGGVDSGLVAALLAETRRPCRAYTLGTPWGNEFSEALEMAVSVGIPIHKIMLSADEILAAIPATVRAFGHGDPETISIGVAITAFCQTMNKPMLLLTGYGSDLINSGMATEADSHGDIEVNVRRAVHRTRYTSEFTATAARACSCKLVHPYWDERVLSIAFRTDASAKYAFGREKGHLRLAAEQYLPNAVAWREKIAIHHGNGIKANLEALIDSHTRINESAEKVYQSMLIEQAKVAITNPQVQVSGYELYKRAIANVASAHKQSKKKLTEKEVITP